MREFPLDGLAARASMLARCAGPDRYYPMVGALFETQKTWVVQGGEGTEKLLQIAKQAGFSKEKLRPVHGRQGAVRKDRRDPHARQ